MVSRRRLIFGLVISSPWTVSLFWPGHDIQSNVSGKSASISKQLCGNSCKSMAARRIL